MLSGRDRKTILSFKIASSFTYVIVSASLSVHFPLSTISLRFHYSEDPTENNPFIYVPNISPNLIDLFPIEDTKDLVEEIVKPSD